MQLGFITLCALTIAGIAASQSARIHADELTVKTEQGKAHGKSINDGKVKAFLGLPYAAPPVGNLRWKAPQPPIRWEGQRDATRFGARCIQGFSYADMSFEDSGPSEDCLFVNVFAPSSANPKTKLPVMFWIHGGGFAAGASSEPRHHGDFLPLKGIVLVTINYRLSAFGFLATPDLAREADGAAGNYGLMDMVAALQWVHANIGNFGGDPGNVTIFGESAGSMAVSALIASPLARGLFQKAIGESGAAFSGANPTDSPQLRQEKDAQWVASLGVHSLQELRALPPNRIAEAVSKKQGGFPVTVDGRLLVEPVEDTYAAGRQAQVPLLAGWNRDEYTALANGMTVEKWKAYAAEHFQERAAEFLKLFPGDTDEQAIRSAIDLNGDQFIAFSTWKWIEAQSKTANAPVYGYHFELPALPSKYHLGSYAFHSDDIEYVFGTLDTRPGETVRADDRKLSELMMSYWTNFAKTGDPNAPGLPAWPRFDKYRQILHLDSSVKATQDTLRPRYEFLLKGIPPYNF